jgi:ferredoxin
MGAEHRRLAMAVEDVYRRLQQHLDRLPQRFPATDSGVELRILRRVFTPEEAALALELSVLPEPAAVIHRRVAGRLDLEALVAALDRMAARGAIHRIESRGVAKYLLAPFVVGFYERQLPWLTADFERDVLQYFDEALGAALPTKKTTQMRTVPVNVDVTPGRDVGTYDDIRAYVRESGGPFAVMDCICRLGKRLVGHTCEHTARLQTCLTFGQAAVGMVETGAARFVSREEMLGLLDEADRDGLVLQPENTQTPLFVCCCCGDCCGVLTTAKRLPQPAEYFSTNYVAGVDAASCEGCGTCLTRCRMDAVSLDSGHAEVAATHCIGCGLCVTTCPSGAIALTKKAHPRVPPRNTPALYLQQYRDRYGALGLAAAAGKHVLGLKV